MKYFPVRFRFQKERAHIDKSKLYENVIMWKQRLQFFSLSNQYNWQYFGSHSEAICDEDFKRNKGDNKKVTIPVVMVLESAQRIYILQDNVIHNKNYVIRSSCDHSTGYIPCCNLDHQHFTIVYRFPCSFRIWNKWLTLTEDCDCKLNRSPKMRIKHRILFHIHHVLESHENIDILRFQWLTVYAAKGFHRLEPHSS